MIDRVLPCDRVNKDRQSISMDRQLCHYCRKIFIMNPKLAAPVGVGANQFFMDSPHLNAIELIADSLTKASRLTDGRFIKINVGVPAKNLGVTLMA